MPIDETSKKTDRWTCGWLVRAGSVWVGVHYSPHNRRFCVNVVPFFTVYIVMPGGVLP